MSLKNYHVEQGLTALLIAALLIVAVVVGSFLHYRRMAQLCDARGGVYARTWSLSGFACLQPLPEQKP
jgi:hypothetical protein